MSGPGKRMRELSIANAKVARRAALTQQRCANYIAVRYEPELETFARICGALAIAADLLLGIEPAAAVRPVPGKLLRSLNAGDRVTLSAVAEGLASRSGLKERREREEPG